MFQERTWNGLNDTEINNNVSNTYLPNDSLNDSLQGRIELNIGRYLIAINSPHN